MSTPRTSSQLGLLLARFTLRHWRQTPRATALQVLILALGIAVFFSIRLANRAAVTSFQNFTGLLAQSTDFVLTAPAGHLAQSVLAELRPLLGEAAGEIIPVLETTAAVPRQQGDASIGGRDTLTLVGLDLVSVQNLAANTGNDRDWFNQAADGSTNTVSRNFWEYLDQTNAAFISPALARKQHWQVGETIPLVIDETVVPLHLAGLIPTSPARPAPPENLLILDLPVLQQLAHRPGQLSRIEFLVPDGPRAAAQRTAWRTTLEQHAAGRWKLSTPADRRESADMMTRAFRMNLTILSLIGLLVGLYLIFQSLDGAVVRRREEIGILRSLGITERDIRRAWLCEAALLGSVGGLAGVLIGWGGAQFAVRFVGQTVNALYYTTSVRSARLDLEEVIFAVILAVGASLVAGWWPARQAAKTPPAQILSRQQDVQTGTPWLQSGALALALLGLAGWLVTWHA
ncbi:MAG TPA: FtsX-like permease family protein, partial [Verrucomicrobiae bacterium]